MPRPSYSSLFDHPNYIGEEYRTLRSSLHTFLQSLVTSSLLGPNIPLNTLFSNTLSLRSSLNVSDHVSHPYKTIGKIIVQYILLFKNLDSKLEDKRSCTDWEQTFHDPHLLLNSSSTEFWFVRVVPKYLNFPTLSKGLFSLFILWLHPAFWSQDVTMYLVLAAFISRPITLLATTRASVFSFIVG